MADVKPRLGEDSDQTDTLLQIRLHLTNGLLHTYK